MAFDWDELKKKAKEVDKTFYGSSPKYLPGVLYEQTAEKKTSSSRSSAEKKAAREDRYASSTVSPKSTQEKKSGGIAKALTTPFQSGPLEGVSVLGSSPKEFLTSGAYTAERLGAGLLGAVENVTDFLGAGLGKGVSAVSSLGGLFPNPVSEWGESVAEHYLTTSPTQAWEESIRNRYNPSKGMENVSAVGQTVARMLPAIGVGSAVSAAGSGINAANAAAKGQSASRALFGLQAAGAGAEEARAEGADTGRALLYGGTSGLLETSIEALAGGIPGLGSGVLTDAVKKVASNPVVAKALDVAGEGGEEALSTIITPFVKRAFYDSDAETATADEIAQSAIMGMAAAGILQAGIRLPSVVGNTVYDIRSVRRSVGSNQDIVNRVNSYINNRPLFNESLALNLPTASETYEYQPGSPLYFNQGSVDQTGGGQGRQARTLPSVDLQEATTPITAPDLQTGAEMVTQRRQGVQVPIETRTWQDAGNRKVNAFQYDHPELRPYYAEAARALKYDLSFSVKGERMPVYDASSGTMDIIGYTGNKRSVTEPIAQALDNANLSYAQIDKAIDDLIADNGQENYAAAKKLELILDDMLTNGYTDSDGYAVPPNQEYIAARERANSGITDSEYSMSEAEWASLMAQEPEGPAMIPTFEQQYGPESSVGAARKGFDPWSEFQGTKSEFFPEGANAARPVDVPTTDPQGNPIRKTASTAMGAKAIPDEVVGDIQNMVMAGELSYNRVTDRASIDRAIKKLSQEGGFQRGLEEFSAAVQKGVISKDLATLGQQLLINAANAGDANATAELLTLYAQMETNAGQAVQAASILRKLSPTAQLYAAQKVASKLEQTLTKKLKGKNITIDQELIKEFNQQTDQEGRDVVLEKIYKNIADQIPSNWRDKWNAWRYLAMLANPRTHVRNFVGNIGFQPLRFAKDRVSSVIEAGVSRAGGNIERTKSFASAPELYRAAWNDWTNVKDVLSGNKYDDVRSEINSRRRIFKTAPLEAARTGNSWLLEFEDSIFKRITYADALAGYLQANGVTAEQVRNNTVDANLMARARDYAGQEALKATYQDRNDLSDLVSERFKETKVDKRTGETRKNHVASAANIALDAVLPFRRTPANILVRGVEYSPVGLAKGLTYDLYKVKAGKMSAAEAIDNIAAGLTGTGLFALGAYLFSEGIVTSGGGDDENQDALNELTGGQNYALNLPGGGNVTLDWLAPEALPFFMGVELMDSIGQNGFTVEGVLDSMASISGPMMELSMLQSLNDMLDNVSYVDSTKKFPALFASSLISYFTQAIPTIGGQFERSGEENRMSTYTDKNLQLPTDIQYAIGRASARIPGWDFQQIPYIDEWGREEPSEPQPLRTFNNFLNPAYTSQENVTPLDEEVQRLYEETGDAGVVPDRAPKYLTVGGERVDLTPEEYVQYATERGQTAFELGSDMIENKIFSGLTDEQKVDALDKVYTYADAMAKANVSDYEPEDWMQKVDLSGIDPVTAILYRMSEAGTNTKRQMIMNDGSLTASEKSSLEEIVTGKEAARDYSSEEAFALSGLSDAGQRKWAKAEVFGLSYEEYVKYYPMVSSGKKVECLQKLEDAGMTSESAKEFWDLIRNS